MTKGLFKSLRKKNKLYKQAINKHSLHPLKIKYRCYRNAYNRLKNKTKQEYYHSKLNVYKNDIRKLWQVYNELVRKCSDKSAIPEVFKIDGNEITDKAVISNEFNEYYLNVGKKIASRISSTHMGSNIF